MKFNLKTTLLPFFTLGAGGLAFVLQLWLLGNVNDLGLLPAGHISQILSYVVMALYLVVLFLFVRKLSQIDSFKALFPASLLRTVGCGFGAIGFLYSGISLCRQGGFVGVLGLILGIFSALALAHLAMHRYTGKRPDGWQHLIPVVYLIVFSVAQVRSWCAAPQTAFCFFPLLSCVFLLLGALHHAKLNIRLEGRRWYVFTSQAAVFFCCGALAGNDKLFYLCMAAWMACDHCTLKNLRKREKPQEEQA